MEQPDVRPTFLRRFPYTVAALGFAVVVFLAAVFGNVNVFDLPELNLIGIESGEVGEVCIAFLLIIPAARASDHHADGAGHRE
jgi:hypothetical protein